MASQWPQNRPEETLSFPWWVFAAVVVLCAAAASWAPPLVLIGGAVWVPWADVTFYSESIGWSALLVRYLMPIAAGLSAVAACTVLTISAMCRDLRWWISAIMWAVAVLSWIWLLANLMGAIVIWAGWLDNIGTV